MQSRKTKFVKQYEYPVHQRINKRGNKRKFNVITPSGELIKKRYIKYDD
jgi:hypothetical protein